MAFIIQLRGTGMHCSNSLAPWWQSMTLKGTKRSRLASCLLYERMCIVVPKAGDVGAGNQGGACELCESGCTSPVKLKQPPGFKSCTSVCWHRSQSNKGLHQLGAATWGSSDSAEPTVSSPLVQFGGTPAAVGALAPSTGWPFSGSVLEGAVSALVWPLPFCSSYSL